MDHYERAKKKLDIKVFNSMQVEAFEVIPDGSDTILLSITGSGKTLAFLLPLLAQIDSKLNSTQVMIIGPTRELALQITNVAQNLAMGFNILCCYGGHPVRFEKKALESNPEVVIGTPGRLLDHIDREHIDPLAIKFLVLDEFDKTLEMGFHKQMESIIKQFRYKPQYILTSATEALEIPGFVPLNKPVIINHIETKDKVAFDILRVDSPSKDKLETLALLINDIGDQSTFVFCNFRESILRVSDFLKSKKIHCDVFHGGLEQIERENAMSKFRNGSTRILITTDLAGRGLDIPHVEHIVHYHLPSSEEVFIHRNGRTARMGASGNAYVIISEADKKLDFIENLEDSYVPSGKKAKLPPLLWSTIMINKGKRDKIRKGDVLGFLIKAGNLEVEAIGMIEVKNKYSLAGIKKVSANETVRLTDKQKIKGKKALVRML